jgi:hypothetical protein
MMSPNITLICSEALRAMFALSTLGFMLIMAGYSGAKKMERFAVLPQHIQESETLTGSGQMRLETGLLISFGLLAQKQKQSYCVNFLSNKQFQLGYGHAEEGVL